MKSKECFNCFFYKQADLVQWPSQSASGKYTLIGVGKCRHPDHLHSSNSGIPGFYSCIDFVENTTPPFKPDDHVVCINHEGCPELNKGSIYIVNECSYGLNVLDNNKIGWCVLLSNMHPAETNIQAFAANRFIPLSEANPERLPGVSAPVDRVVGQSQELSP